jgi:hypothetical protein
LKIGVRVLVQKNVGRNKVRGQKSEKGFHQFRSFCPPVKKRLRS